MNTLIREESKPALGSTSFLSEWINKGTLVSLILDAAQRLDWPERDLRLAARSGYAFRRPVLLSVVTYCYASGIYNSKDIALRVSRDEILGFLCAGTFPTWQDIRDFSRHNRDLIRQALLQAHKLAREYRLRTGTIAPPKNPGAEWSGDQTRVDFELQLAEGAETRVDPLAYSDSLALAET
jgi:hypothetical protein